MNQLSLEAYLDVKIAKREVLEILFMNVINPHYNILGIKLAVNYKLVQKPKLYRHHSPWSMWEREIVSILSDTVMSKNTTERSQSRIMELAGIISKKTAELDGYLFSRNLPFPSFDIDAPLDFHLSEELEISRSLAIDAITELRELLLGPKDLLLSNVVRPVLQLTLDIQKNSESKIINLIPAQSLGQSPCYLSF